MNDGEPSVEILAEFEDITTTAIIMPGCKAIIYFIGRDGVKHSIPVQDVVKIDIISEQDNCGDGRVARVITGKGSVDIS